MGGVYNTKETEEALVAVVTLGTVVLNLVKDGVQMSDAVALGTKLVTDSGFREALKAGADKIELVPSELAEVDMDDAAHLAATIPRLIAIMQGK